MNRPPPRNRASAQAGLALQNARLPSLSAIRAFEAAARLGSFARAAAELDTTPASVSYHVRRLEQQTGIALFVRGAQSVELTSQARVLAAQATEAFATLRAGFINAIDAEAARLALTTLPTFASAWLTPRLGRFRTSWPDIAVELDLSETAHDLIDGRFDAAIRNGHGHWPGLRATYLFPSIFTPLCAPAVRDAARSLANPRAPGIPLLGRPDWWARWYRALGLADVALEGKFGTALPTEYLDITAAIAGQGVAIGSPILFHNEIASGRLVPAHELVAGDGRAFWLAVPSGRETRPKLAHFRDWLLDEVSSALHMAERFVRGAVT